MYFMKTGDTKNLMETYSTWSAESIDFDNLGNPSCHLINLQPKISA
jgi:hypothetical protein